MYLAPWETPLVPAFRVIERKRRAAKLTEIFQQLTWLEANISEAGPYMMGEKVTLADFTWFPTLIFMEFLLPRVYGWPKIFDDDACGFPKLGKWYRDCKAQRKFASVHKDVWDFWVEKDKE